MMRGLAKSGWVFVALVAVAALLVAPCRVAPTTPTMPTAPTGGLELGVAKPVGSIGQQLDFRNEMRRLWDEHAVWTRLAVMGLALDSPDLQASVERLMQNQVDIGDAIKPYYGIDAGDKLTGLLKDHIMIAADLVKAVKADDMTMVGDLQTKWSANADEIAVFLNGTNPTVWPLPTVSSALRSHLGYTLDEAQAILKGDWKGSVEAYDRGHMQLLGMADVLSAGIISQFPNMFMTDVSDGSRPYRSIY